MTTGDPGSTGASASRREPISTGESRWWNDSAVQAMPSAFDGGGRPAWQRMLSGRRLDILDPDSGDIALDDIAHGLARVARWNGQTRGPQILSVAQHSILVEALLAHIAPEAKPTEKLTALLHDAPEYVVGDLISPFKAFVGETYRSVEERLFAAILRRFGLAVPSAGLLALIKRADRAAARLEAVTLAGFDEGEAFAVLGPPEPGLAGFVPWLAPRTADEVQRDFLARCHALGISSA